MEGTKTYVFGQDGNNANLLSTIAPLLQKQGVDPSVLAMMNNNGFGGNNFIWAIFLLALFGWGGNGFGFGNNGNNGAGFLANQLNNSEGRDLLMQAIQGNHDALNQLASTMQVNATAVQNGFSNVMQSLCNIGNSVGMTGQQVINALQSGNMQIAQQIATASAQSQLGMCQQTNALQNSVCEAKTQLNQGLTMLGFQGERQTATLQQTMNENTQKILDGQKQAEIREMQAVINAQATEIASLKTSASTQQIIATALAPIQQAIAALQTGGTATRTTTAGA